MVEVVYTNKNCIDVFNVFIEERKSKSGLPLYVISDFDASSYDIAGNYIYNDDEPYYMVWINALNQFNVDQFIYLQEDFILYDKVDLNKINEYSNYLKNSEYSFIRLIKSGILNNNRIYDNLFEIESDNSTVFAMQPTIWKTSDYIKVMSEVKEEKWLEIPKYREVIIYLKLKGLYYYNGERKVGGAHYDTKLYPYIATAVIKGKWNYREYKNELEPMLIKHNIDVNKRGIF